MCPHTYFDSGHLMCKSSHYHKHTIYKFGKLDFITWPPQRVSQVHTHSVLALYNMWKKAKPYKTSNLSLHCWEFLIYSQITLNLSHGLLLQECNQKHQMKERCFLPLFTVYNLENIQVLILFDYKQLQQNVISVSQTVKHFLSDLAWCCY